MNLWSWQKKLDEASGVGYRIVTLRVLVDQTATARLVGHTSVHYRLIQFMWRTNKSSALLLVCHMNWLKQKQNKMAVGTALYEPALSLPENLKLLKVILLPKVCRRTHRNLQVAILHAQN